MARYGYFFLLLRNKGFPLLILSPSETECDADNVN